jgi:hypothetical protein
VAGLQPSGNPGLRNRNAAPIKAPLFFMRQQIGRDAWKIIGISRQKRRKHQRQGRQRRAYRPIF